MRTLMTVALLAVLAPALKAQSPVNGPAIGFVFDQAERAVRPVLGVPGSTKLGASLAIGRPLSNAAIAPRQDYALGVSADGAELLVTDLSRPDFTARPLLGGRAGADKIVFSPAGASAAIYHRGFASVQVFTGMPGAPKLAAELDVATASGALSALAISDDGASVLAAFTQGSAGVLYLARGGSAPRIAASLGAVSDIQFLHERSDAFLSDIENSRILYLAKSAEKVVLLADEKDGISRPVALAISTDNRRVFVANAASGAVTALNAFGGVLRQVSCGCTPSRLERMQGDSVFRITDGSHGPMLLFDAAASRVVFVPMSAPLAAAGGRKERE